MGIVIYINLCLIINLGMNLIILFNTIVIGSLFLPHTHMLKRQDTIPPMEKYLFDAYYELLYHTFTLVIIMTPER